MSETPRTTIRCVVCGGLHLNAHEADDKIDRLQSALFASQARERVMREALEKIMHARGNPASSVTNMGRSMMREIAAAALSSGAGEGET
jgi:hypothetical protein